MLLAGSDAAADDTTELVRGTIAGFDLEPEVPVLLVAVPRPEGFTIRRVPLDEIRRMEVYQRISASGNSRQGYVDVGQLHPPEVERREALDRSATGGPPVRCASETTASLSAVGGFS